jgi:uncharacterized protein (TIGR01244 family)
MIARALTSHREGQAWIMRRRTQAEMDNRKQVPYDEAAVAKELGINYVHVPLGGPDTPYTPEAVAKVAAAMKAADGKVLLHCTVAWRASHLWAAYLIQYRHVPVETALAQTRTINLMDDMRMSQEQPLEGFLGHAVPEMIHPKD